MRTILIVILLVLLGGCQWAAHKRQYTPGVTVVPRAADKDNSGEWYLVTYADGTQAVMRKGSR